MTLLMSAFNFSRRDLWHRNFKQWRRKCRPLISKPHLTVVLLLVAVLLYRIGSDSNSEGPVIRNKVPSDSNLRTPRSPKVATNIPQAVVLLLAPQRNADSMWNNVERFCFLRRAVRSIDRHLNAKFGPYPIVILVAKDHDQDPTHQDGAYTARDRALVEEWAIHSTIQWHEVDMYSKDALEPEVSLKQILAWRRGEDGGQEGRPLGYQSMCRLWSGRLQNFDILDGFDLYMRLDDDSLLMSDLEYDPFKRFLDHNLIYAYRRQASDHWGIQELWKVAEPHVLNPTVQKINVATRLEFLQPTSPGSDDDKAMYQYHGKQPYNNFHISRVDFWRSRQWKSVMNDMDKNHLFFKHRVGDANVHAMALLMMGDQHIEQWEDFPYAHNSNDMGEEWGPKEWKEECNGKS
ncbi:glycolipid 2-alpha-mannosyltransferase [Nitzschia inconspicua]|uniref:Glycolipid 2-alpha-mannosyltransferase n=1 Tax=Nitzschia inconspicua TaxID=303405 RepID=A0A9K3Q677_9STRA|nr:glycolipid 2-alpha-mannosyltransferase [Nitzschia inconspicua]